MTLQEDGQILLNNHATLFEQIKSLPLTRPIYYREDLEEGHCIGKPRFHHRKLQWSPEILTTLHNHLQNLWNFFFAILVFQLISISIEIRIIKKSGGINKCFQFPSSNNKSIILSSIINSSF